MNKRMKAKLQDLLLFALFYVIAYLAAWLITFRVEQLLLRLFLFDIVATVIIYLLSLPIKNPSLYDAYWSLTPFVMLTYLLLTGKDFNLFHFLLFAVFSIWSFRLTINWVVTFGGRNWIDWRYRQLKEQNSPVLWPVIDLFGIMLMPTLLVFAGFVPLVFAFTIELNALSLIGMLFILLGTTLEFFADRQMHSFLKYAEKGQVIDCGLWKYSRHPNYLGEIIVWVGVYFSLFPASPAHWFTFGGAVLMILLFNFISIPLAEKRQIAKREAYALYRQSTSRLLLLPRRESK